MSDGNPGRSTRLKHFERCIQRSNHLLCYCFPTVDEPSEKASQSRASGSVIAQGGLKGNLVYSSSWRWGERGTRRWLLEDPIWSGPELSLRHKWLKKHFMVLNFGKMGSAWAHVLKSAADHVFGGRGELWAWKDVHVKCSRAHTSQVNNKQGLLTTAECRRGRPDTQALPEELFPGRS